jgi:Flp pilus assembly protein TadD
MRLIPIWQMANLVMFVVAFAGPWFSLFGGRVNGFFAGRFFWYTTFGGLLFDGGWNILADLVVEPRYLWICTVSPVVFVGIACIGFYWGMSLVRAVFANQCWMWRKVLLDISLTGSITGLLVLTIFLSSTVGLNRCFWGYWLVVGSLGSSVLLEVVNARVTKKIWKYSNRCSSTLTGLSILLLLITSGIIFNQTLDNIATSFTSRGIANTMEGNYDEAIVDFNYAIMLQLHSATAYYHRGEAYYHTGDYDRAIADFDQSIQLQPDDAAFYICRGNSYISKGDYKQAISDYNQAIRLQSDSSLAYYNRGFVYFTMGEYQRAIADFDQSIQLQPDDAKPYYSRGVAYQHIGDYDRAIADYERFLELGGNSCWREQAEEQLESLSPDSNDSRIQKSVLN